MQLRYKDRNCSERQYSDPVLVQGVDGVGTKIKLAEKLNKWDTIGFDLVAMCANDVICTGAQPFAFLDYIACGKLEVQTATDIIKGITDACLDIKTTLIGIFSKNS